MLRAHCATDASCCYGPGAHAIDSKLHDRDEAVPAGAVPMLGVRVGARAEGRERTPFCGRESDCGAWRRVIEVRLDLVVQPLETVDFAPRDLPGAEVCLEFIARRPQRLQPVSVGRFWCR